MASGLLKSSSFLKVGFFTSLLFVSCFLVFSLLRPHAGLNAWRDGQTYGVAKGFHENGIDLLRPEFDLRRYESGILPSELPLFNAIAAIGMNLFGPSYTIARSTNLILFLLVAVLIFFYFQRFQDFNAGIFGIWLLLANSVLLIQSTAIMPEMLSVFLSMLAWFLFFRIKPSISRAVLLSFILALATLVKPSGFGAAIAIASYLVFEKRQTTSIRRIFEIAFVIFIPVFSLFLWKDWMLPFGKNVYNGAAVTHHFQRNLSVILSELDFEVFYHALKKSFMHSMGIAGCLFFGLKFSAWFIKRLSKSKNGIKPPTLIQTCFLMWIFSLFGFLLLSGDAQTHQTYYATPMALPFVLFLAGLFSEYAKTNLRSKVLVILLGLQTMGSLYYFNREVLSESQSWDQHRQVVREGQKLFSRKDRILSFGPRGFFPALSRIEAIGYIDDHISEFKKIYTEFDFVYLWNTEGKRLAPFFEKRLGKPFVFSDGSLMFEVK